MREASQSAIYKAHCHICTLAHRKQRGESTPAPRTKKKEIALHFNKFTSIIWCASDHFSGHSVSFWPLFPTDQCGGLWHTFSLLYERVLCCTIEILLLTGNSTHYPLHCVRTCTNKRHNQLIFSHWILLGTQHNRNLIFQCDACL